MYRDASTVEHLEKVSFKININLLLPSSTLQWNQFHKSIIQLIQACGMVPPPHIIFQWKMLEKMFIRRPNSILPKKYQSCFFFNFSFQPYRSSTCVRNTVQKIKIHCALFVNTVTYVHPDRHIHTQKSHILSWLAVSFSCIYNHTGELQQTLFHLSWDNDLKDTLHTRIRARDLASTWTILLQRHICHTQVQQGSGLFQGDRSVLSILSPTPVIIWTSIVSPLKYHQAL